MDNGVLYMTDTKQKSAARAFAEYWKDKGYEKGESQAFWLSLLREVFGVAEPEKLIRTSIENIHKVIDPLFLDALKKELEEIQAIEVWKTKEKSLTAFQKKLASLDFLEILSAVWIQSHDSSGNEPPFEYPLKPLSSHKSMKKGSEPLTFISCPEPLFCVMP